MKKATDYSLKAQKQTHNQSKSSTLKLIYAGGTFGSYGRPLDALPADVFVPLLTTNIQKSITTNIEVLTNNCVKDSSQLLPQDFVHFYQLILSHYHQNSRQFVLITGTDTLSYLGAFLAEAFAGSDICIVLTASMRPLFDTNDIHQYNIDNHSDAWDNLNDAIGLASYAQSGVYVAFGGESWPAQTVQKIHSHDLMAFTGHHRAGYPANSFVKSFSEVRLYNWLEDRKDEVANLTAKAKNIIIPSLYCIPNSTDWLATQLLQFKTLPATGIILIGFGAGNLPYDNTSAKLLNDLHELGHIVVCTTQCPFGGVSSDYAAGSWQYRHHVLSAGRLTIPAIYARLLWLHLTLDTPTRRRQRWTHTIQKQS